MKDKMNIAILYICTGNYTVFWDKFLTSCEEFFFPEHQKAYFVFTDGVINTHENKRVRVIPQENLGWPDNTLKRYSMFMRILPELKSFDFIFFFNANSQFQQTIGEEILPTIDEGLVVVRHPGFYNSHSDEFSYERNPASKAYIPKGHGKYYICGGINGGHATKYCQMIQDLHAAIAEDEAKKIIALWHDESHINKYILSHPHKLLPPAYCHPEGWDIPFEQIIFIRDKVNKFGGLDYLRGTRTSSPDLCVRIRKKISSFLKKLLR